MTPLRSDARDLVAERLHWAADCVRVVGARVERGEDCMAVLRELVLARILLDEARFVLTAHEAQICLAILTDSAYPIDVRRASADCFTRLCAG